ncbi:hypothetical protein Dimus_033058 [Dionaea muscipula]
MAMEANKDGFVAWEEKLVSQEKGNRVVHFFLKDSSGNSVLAVLGTERSVRHMIYYVSEKFVEDHGAVCRIRAGIKWRTRREVIEWLTFLVSKHRQHLASQSGCHMLYNGNSTSGCDANLTPKAQELECRKMMPQNSDIAWSGAAWTCSKRLIHFPSYSRHGITISVHSFVFIRAVERSQYLGYLEDMYEDKKGQKKVKVRWFHQSEELRGAFPQLNAHPREVVITPHVQVISAECIDGPAAVLTPEHYERCLAIVPHTFWSKLHFCFRQYKNDEVKPFGLSKLHGYLKQAVLSCLDQPVFSNKHNADYCDINDEKEQGIANVDSCKRGAKRSRTLRDQRSEASPSVLGSQITKSEHPNPKLKLKFSLKKLRDLKPQFSASLKVNDEIELLCQDSGIRGCWFRCKVLQVSQKSLKVQYDDLQDADEFGNLEEWIPAHRVAAPDKLGMRCAGRLIVRPRPPQDSADCITAVGEAVDVWWSDGWWEGVLTSVDESHPGLQVYLPGESRHLTVRKQNIRTSRDWVDGGWVIIKPKPDVLAYVSASSNSNLMKLPNFSPDESSIMPGCAIMLNHGVPRVPKLEPIKEEEQENPPAATSDAVLTMEEGRD